MSCFGPELGVTSVTMTLVGRAATSAPQEPERNENANSREHTQATRQIHTDTDTDTDTQTQTHTRFVAAYNAILHLHKSAPKHAATSDGSSAISHNLQLGAVRPGMRTG